jgi:hypothetical protein
MAPLTDPTILAKFQHALSEWKYAGYITWKRVAQEWVERNPADPTIHVVSIHEA